SPFFSSHASARGKSSLAADTICSVTQHDPDGTNTFRRSHEQETSPSGRGGTDPRRQQLLEAEWELLCHVGLLHSLHQGHISIIAELNHTTESHGPKTSNSWRAREKTVHIPDSSSTNPQKDMCT
ncbi:mCG56487, partial [Mus musculus]